MSHTRSETSSDEQITLFKYFQANFELAKWKIATAAATQPLQTMLRTQQAALKKENKVFSIRDSARYLSQHGGVAGFYKGTISGASKEGAKSIVYKGAILTYSPLFASQFFDKTQHPIYFTLMSGMTTGFIEASVGGPLESLATFRATSHGSDKSAKFFEGVSKQQPLQQNLSIIFNSCYRGFFATWLKTGVASTAYFAAGNYISPAVSKQVFQAFPELESKHAKEWVEAVSTGTQVAIASAPLDIIKTLQQSPNASQQNILQILQNNFKQFGLNGVATGTTLKFIQILIGWTVTAYALKNNQSKHAMFKPADKAIMESTNINEARELRASKP